VSAAPECKSSRRGTQVGTLLSERAEDVTRAGALVAVVFTRDAAPHASTLGAGHTGAAGARGWVCAPAVRVPLCVSGRFLAREFLPHCFVPSECGGSLGFLRWRIWMGLGFRDVLTNVG
jgi:hypothetical protein